VIFTILRDSKIVDIDVTLKKFKKLIPYLHDTPSEYLVYGGVIIMPLSKNYLQAWGKNWSHDAPAKLLTQYYDNNYNTEEIEDYVFIKQILPHKVNSGYPFVHQQIKAINGVAIHSFKEAVNFLTNSKDEIIKIETNGHAMIVLNRKEAIKANKEILNIYGIKKALYLREEK